MPQHAYPLVSLTIVSATAIRLSLTLENPRRETGRRNAVWECQPGFRWSVAAIPVIGEWRRSRQPSAAGRPDG